MHCVKPFSEASHNGVNKAVTSFDSGFYFVGKKELVQQYVRTSFFSQRIAANDPSIAPIQRKLWFSFAIGFIV